METITVKQQRKIEKELNRLMAPFENVAISLNFSMTNYNKSSKSIKITSLYLHVKPSNMRGNIINFQTYEEAVNHLTNAKSLVELTQYTHLKDYEIKS